MTADSPPQVYVVVHGHFYQPPRENPWIEEIELEESAYPFPNWNARITRECYNPNTCARIRDDKLRILDIVNNFSLINFNIGPTLFAWLAANAPITYARILAADRESLARLGHGNAIAQAYNHVILPLAHPQDLETQIIWGLKDFTYRFGRQAEAMWLPETAVNLTVLQALIRHGMKYVILAPTQAARIRPLSGGPWQPVTQDTLDTTQPYRCFVGPGRQAYIDIFFYDGPTAAGLSFGDLLSDSARLLAHLGQKLDPAKLRPQLLHVATDGETFGHHKRFGEMGLAYALARLCPERGWRVTNYASFLAQYSPTMEVEISLGPLGEGSSWSCAHGVGRWQRDCGCSTGGLAGWNQAWRAPLREAFDLLRQELAQIFTKKGGKYFKDPWAARNDYLEVILTRDPEVIDAFFQRHGKARLKEADRIPALKLLEMQRHALLMYTSCGWFFADLAGLETLQVLKYAARALQLAQDFTPKDLETPFLAKLEQARSNLPEMGTGKDLYLNKIKPAVITFPKLVNQFSITLLKDRHRQCDFCIYHYKNELLDYAEKSHGGLELALGRVKLTSRITLESQVLGYATLFMGSYLYRTQVKEGMTAEEFTRLTATLFKALEEAPEDIIQAMRNVFGSRYYTVRDMFKKEKRDILWSLLLPVREEAEAGLRHIFGEAKPLLLTMAQEGLVLPPVFRLAAGATLGREIGEVLTAWEQGEEAEFSSWEINELLETARMLRLQLDSDHLGDRLARLLETRLQELAAACNLTRAASIRNLLQLARQLPLEVDLTEAQNLFFGLLAANFPRLLTAARQGDQEARRLAALLLEIGSLLNFSLPQYETQLAGLPAGSG